MIGLWRSKSNASGELIRPILTVLANSVKEELLI